uniref:Uncharacterized protein n=1 Tax=Anguilla anguilla TaxID=7936 RepID=A0A0E9URD1_ANGAN
MWGGVVVATVIFSVVYFRFPIRH